MGFRVFIWKIRNSWGVLRVVGLSKKGKELTDMVIVVGVGVEEGVRKMVVEKYNKIINEIKQSKIK